MSIIHVGCIDKYYDDLFKKTKSNIILSYNLDFLFFFFCPRSIGPSPPRSPMRRRQRDRRRERESKRERERENERKRERERG